MIGAFRIYICAAAVYVMLASLLVLFGWMVNNEQLISLFPAMNGKVLPFLGQLHSSAAICLFLLSVAFLLGIPASDWCRRISAAICSFVFVSSLPAIYVAITRDDFEPIRIMQPDPAASGITFPVPMAVEVAASMILLSISILFLCLPFKNSVKISQMISVSAMAIPLLIILGAATRVPQICALGGCFTMSTGFALLCLALSSAIFLVRPDLEFAALFSARTMGGALLRRVIMFCFIVPFLLIARTVAVHSQIDIDEQTAWLVFIFLILLSMVALVVSGVKAVDQMEHERTRIASELKDALDKQQEIAGALKQTKEQLELSRRSGNNSGSSSGNSTTKYKMVCLECAQEFDEPQQTCPVDGSKLSRVIDDSLIGTVFLDKYVVKELIGSGGMSTVYRATHLYVDRDVAIKFLKEKALLHPANLKRFM